MLQREKGRRCVLVRVAGRAGGAAGEEASRADEPRRAATLFTPLLRRELLAQLQPRAMFMLNDSGCAAHGHHQWASEAWLKTGIHTMARVCQLVANARSRVPVAQSLQQQRETWAKFASANATSTRTTAKRKHKKKV